MRECNNCDAEATLVATKRFHAITTHDRFYCDKCHSEIERKDDIILLVSLFASLLLLGAAIFLYNNTTKSTLKTEADAIEIQRQARDFDNDGVVDIWEEQATDAQISNYNSLGYPCEDIEGTATSSRAILAVIPSSKWIAKFKNNKGFKNALNYPVVMGSFIEKYTNPESVHQLDNALLTTSGEIAFVVKKFAKAPKTWENHEIKPEKATPATDQAEEVEPKSTVPLLDATVCYEQLSRREAKQVAKILGISEEGLTAAYR
jgi:hypothetical protein